MSEYDRPGYFYLGKRYDPKTKQVMDEPILYDARDMTTHGVCVGMTGSGKTGLCVLFLEEAALNGIPSIIIDPKGDITNLCLTFPDLAPQDFEPWINTDDARRKGMSVPEYAAKTADTWRKGLADWGEGPERIQRMKDKAEFRIYTPGSNAGLPVSILDSMRAPALEWEGNEDALREKISGTVSALLGLVGIQADPIKSREHILLANIFEHSWRQKEDLSIAKLIQFIHEPPMRKLGVFDIDTFFRPDDRFQLSMSFNNILAAPSFENWIQGQPLDLESLLYTPEGKPCASIFYIAHLDDAQRMFFVTLLLEQVTSWMRTLSGTTNLRALVYFDEVFGYFPPYPANPPSKGPLLTLLKQARAFGVGTLLTTQNPVDLDYKGLTNAGTWMIGKLQTDRDKMRVLEGLEGAINESGSSMNRQELDRLISALDSRVFILHNVHEDEPQVFMTRWAMSYLRGPLTRSQIQQLKEMQGMTPTTKATDLAREQTPSAPAGLSATAPQIGPDIPQYFVRSNLSMQQSLREQTKRDRFLSLKPEKAHLIYEPKVLASVTVDYQNTTYDISHSSKLVFLADAMMDPSLMDWDQAEIALSQDDISPKPEGEAYYADLPDGMGQRSDLKALNDSLSEHLYRTKQLQLWRNSQLKLVSRVGESEKDFEDRCRQAMGKLRDAQVDKIKSSYEVKLDQTTTKLKREERELADDEAELQSRKWEERAHLGESILTVLSGRKSSRALSSATRKRRMTSQAKADVTESVDSIAALQAEIEELKANMLKDIADVDEDMDKLLQEREEYAVKPRRVDVRIDLFGIGWFPRWQVRGKDDLGNSAQVTLPAYTSQDEI